MYTVVLTIHLIIILALIGVVLVQRSEGGGLGIGGGGGNPLGGRAKPNPLATVTWVLAAAFIANSVFLTILSNQEAQSRGVLEGFVAGDGADTGSDVVLPGDLTGDTLLPPSATDVPLAPPPVE
ncbi:MAG: preprotein translocase subunit SecG [Pseudomonadota bacterium]